MGDIVNFPDKGGDRIGRQDLDEHQFMALLHKVIVLHVQEPNHFNAQGLHDLFEQKNEAVLDLWNYVNTGKEPDFFKRLFKDFLK